MNNMDKDAAAVEASLSLDSQQAIQNDQEQTPPILSRGASIQASLSHRARLQERPSYSIPAREQPQRSPSHSTPPRECLQRHTPSRSADPRSLDGTPRPGARDREQSLDTSIDPQVALFQNTLHQAYAALQSISTEEFGKDTMKDTRRLMTAMEQEMVDLGILRPRSLETRLNNVTEDILSGVIQPIPDHRDRCRDLLSELEMAMTSKGLVVPLTLQEHFEEFTEAINGIMTPVEDEEVDIDASEVINDALRTLQNTSRRIKPRNTEDFKERLDSFLQEFDTPSSSQTAPAEVQAQRHEDLEQFRSELVRKRVVPPENKKRRGKRHKVRFSFTFI